MNLRNVANALAALAFLLIAQHVFADVLGSDAGVQVAFLGFVGKIVGGAAKGIVKGVTAVGKTVAKAAPSALTGFLAGGPVGAAAGAGGSVLGQIGLGGQPSFDTAAAIGTGPIVATPDPRFSGRTATYTPTAQPNIGEFFSQQINTVREALAQQILKLGSAGTTAVTRIIAPDGTEADRALAIPTDVRTLQKVVIFGGLAIVGAFAFLALRPARGR